MKLTRIAVRNYRGISVRDEEVAPSGAIAKGRNGSGKTSILKAIRAALSAQDIGSDAIRTGADRAEILIDLDDIEVRRTITQSGSALKVTRQGMQAPKPQTFLTELLGNTAIDPLDLFLAKPKDRKAKILQALPVTVTAQDIQQWAPVPDDIDVSGHGLEALERIRAAYYAERTDANKAAASAAREAERLRGIANLHPWPDARVPSCEAADAELRAASDGLTKLEAQAKAAQASAARSGPSLARAEELHAMAMAARTQADAESSAAERHPAEEDALALTEDVVKELQSRLAQAMAQRDEAKARVDGCLAACKRHERLSAEAASLDCQAEALRAAVSAAAVPEVSPSEIEAARNRLANAKSGAALAADAHRAAEEARVAEAAEAEAARVAKWASELDGIVKDLSTKAPDALLAKANSIRGLSLDGDDVYLDGIRIDALCGAEQMRFAVEIAKRLNAKSKILIVDKLEALDPEQCDAFVRFATADGWQLIATRVDRGDVVLEAIAPEDQAAAAE